MNIAKVNFAGHLSHFAFYYVLLLLTAKNIKMKAENLPLVKACCVRSVYGHKFAQNLAFSYTLVLLQGVLNLLSLTNKNINQKELTNISKYNSSHSVSSIALRKNVNYFILQVVHLLFLSLLQIPWKCTELYFCFCDMISQLCTSAVHTTCTDMLGIAAYSDGSVKGSNTVETITGIDGSGS